MQSLSSLSDGRFYGRIQGRFHDLSDATFRRLQALAKPLIDTPSTVIDRMIDHYEDGGEVTPPSPMEKTPPR